MAKASKIISLAVVLLLAALVLPIPRAHVAEATVLPSDVWVAPPPAGNDSNPGTEAQPFATIQWGINNVALNDGTVHVAAGTYHENLSIDDAQDLVGAGAQDTIIDGGGLYRVLAISSATYENVVSGFTIQNGNLLVTSIWNPTDEQVLYAGINLDFIKTMPRLFNFVGEGGGIYIGGSHIVTLNDCVIKDNHAEYGGGIYNNSQLYMNRCTVSGNSATLAGGGICNNGQMWLTNCTISGNIIISSDPGTQGVGISNGCGDMTLINCTIANNTTTDPDCRGGGFYNGGTATFKNTIVANNTAGTGNNGYNNVGTITSQGYNLDSEHSCGFNQPTDLVNTDPLLSPLQDNGGPTFTHALLHGSPAIDAGTCTGAPTTDQRGIPRPQGSTCDIGAYELAQASVTTTTDTGTAYFSTLNGYITDLTALDESELDCIPNGALDFPNGLFSFTVTDITPGSTATIVIILPSDMPTDTQYWKCLNEQWVDATSILGSNDGDSVLTLTLTDGGPFDADGQVNGTIVDPSGPAVVVVAAPVSTPIRPPTLKPAQMAVQYLGITPQQTFASQQVTISTNVVNTGDQPGSLNVVLKINGKVEQTKLVSLGPHGTQPIKFTVARAQPGTYTVDIGGQKGSFTILGPGAGGTSSSDRMTGILIIIGVLVLAVALVVWLLIRRPA